jgi:hypothetical protein
MVTYGDTTTRVCGFLRRPTARLVRKATARAIRKHDDASQRAGAAEAERQRLERIARSVGSDWSS